jgi:hypothetical protein
MGRAIRLKFNQVFKFESFFTFIPKYCLFDHIQTESLNVPFVCDEIDDNGLIESLIAEYKVEGVLTEKIQKQLFKKSDLPCASVIEEFGRVRDEWLQFHSEYTLVAKLLFEILKRFPTENSDKTFRISSFTEFYIQICCMSSKQTKFTESEQFVNLKKLLQLSSETTLADIFDAFMNLSCSISNENLYTNEFLIDLNNLTEIFFSWKNSTDENEEDQVQLTLAKTRRRSLSRKSLVDSSNLMDTERISPVKNPKARRKTLTKPPAINTQVTFRHKFIEWLANKCSHYFDDDYTTSMEYSKYFCYNDFENLKQRLFDNQRINVHESMLNPFKYIFHSNNDQSNKIKDEKFNLPLSIIYKIYLECGHMINLFDWLQVKLVVSADLVHAYLITRLMKACVGLMSITFNFEILLINLHIKS